MHMQGLAGWLISSYVTAVIVTSNMTASVIGHHSGRWPVRYISVLSSKKALEATSVASQLWGSKALRTVFLESPACSLSCCSGADRGGNGRIWMAEFLLERGTEASAGRSGLGLVQHKMAQLNPISHETLAELPPTSRPVLQLLNGKVGPNGLQGTLCPDSRTSVLGK